MKLVQNHKKPFEWRPPNFNKCVEAFELNDENFREAPNVSKLLRLNTWNLYTQKLKPTGDDWLADGNPGVEDRVGQTVTDFIDIFQGLFPTKNQGLITLVPVGPVDSNFMKIIKNYCEIFFCMEVEIGEELDVSQYKLRQRCTLPQLKTGDAYKHLEDRRHKDQFCVLGVTMFDLYPDEKWNFVFGEACVHQKIGLFSLCRHLPGWWRYSEYSEIDISNLEDKDFQKFLLGSLETVAHEICHLFGINHCVYFECMMNGVNTEEERDRSPVILCPICQRKLAAAINIGLKSFDSIERCKNLIQFFRKNDITGQAEFLQSVLEKVNEEEIEDN